MSAVAAPPSGASSRLVSSVLIAVAVFAAILALGGVLGAISGAVGGAPLGAAAANGVIATFWALVYILALISAGGAVAYAVRAVFRLGFSAQYWARALCNAPVTAWFGMITIAAYVFAGIFADVLAPYGEYEVVGGALLPSGSEASAGNVVWLGTDQVGRDILSRLIYGARNTVGIAFMTTCLAFVLGGGAGLLAATIGGWLEQGLSRFVDVLMAIPSLIFALLLLTIFKGAIPDFSLGGITIVGDVIVMMLVLAVLDATRVYRLARAVAINVVVMDYIEAAKLRGEGLGYLIMREILPNTMAPLVAEFGLRFCFVFLAIAALSFLGLGIQPPIADWASMVAENKTLISFASFDLLTGIIPLIPAAAIALLTVAVNFVVDWMLHRASGLKE